MTTGMKFSLATAGAIILLVGASLIAAGPSDEEAWQEFKDKFEKHYESQDEEIYRMKVYLDNKLYIESQNLKSDGSVTFNQGLNPLSDLTTEEINQSRCGFRLPANETSDDDHFQAFSRQLKTTLTSLNETVRNVDEVIDALLDNKAWYDTFGPPELDYRKQGRVSRVKDQGSCGSCWAFATTGALEGVLASRNRSILLSEQNLVDCSSRYGNHGCSGGLMDAALRYVRDHGIMSGHEYPYSAKDGKCKFRRDRSVMRVRGSGTLPRGNEALLRLALAYFGPIPVAIDASSKAFHSYKSGVYNAKGCQNSRNSLNHAVLLIGYGTDRIGGDFWLVKNSWGNKWGDNGYIKMARNQRNFCGIASYAVVPIA